MRGSPGMPQDRHPPRPAKARLVLAAIGALLTTPAAPQSAERLLQNGFYFEAVLCDPEAAIGEYQKILELDSASPPLVARTHLRLGVCYRLSGEKALADEHFRIVTTIYSGDAKTAELARTYLGSNVRQDPARFMPEDLFLYIELVSPDEQIGKVAEVLRGTPFQNPVDYAMSGPGAGGRGAAKTRDRPVWVRGAAAVLNRGFLRELQKVKGLAIGVPAGQSFEESHLVVILPGESHVLHGLFQVAATTFFTPGEQLHGFPVYSRTRRGEEVHLAFGDDVVLLGRPRGLIEEALERYLDHRPSLSTEAGFRRTQKVRAQTDLFVYMSRHWYPALAGSVEDPRAREALEALAAAFGCKEIETISLAASTHAPSDTLDVDLHAWRDGSSPPGPLWNAFRTRPIDPVIGRWLPAEALALFAMRPDPALERTSVLVGEASSLTRVLPPDERAELVKLIDLVKGTLLEGPGRDLLGELEGLVAGVMEGGGGVSHRSWFLVLEVEDPARGEVHLRDTLSEVAYRLTKTAASREFRAEELAPGAGRDTGDRRDRRTWHYLEPVPGIRPGYVLAGRRFVLSLSRSTLAAAAAGLDEDTAVARVPPGASKVLFVRPAALIRAAAGPDDGKGPGAGGLLSFVETLVVHTNEERDHLSVKLRVPHFTPAVRGVLDRVGRENPGARSADSR